MRRFWLVLAMLGLSLLAFRPGLAAAGEVQIHLLIMGPGDHLYTRAGHAALMVGELEDGALVRSTVYNYGDTDWEDPLLVPHFLRGDLVFFLSDTGSLMPTLEQYGVRQGRTVSRQRLNLSPAQVTELERRLREGTAPGKREYRFDHMRAVCSTRIMAVLDEVLGGRLRAELGNSPGPHPGRHYTETVFGSSVLAAVAGDLFMGRLHDRVLDKYESTMSPENMRDYLQTVLVPAPSGAGAMVPLAEAPLALVERHEPLVVGKSWLSHGLWGALMALLLGYGASAHRRAAAAPARAAKVMFWAALSSGLVGSLILGFIVLSRVPEFRQNELILLFWPTDLWLAGRVRRIVNKTATPDGWVQNYVVARLGLAGLVVLGHLAGVLYQEPRILVALGCVEAAVLWALVRALRGHTVARKEPVVGAPEMSTGS